MPDSHPSLVMFMNHTVSQSGYSATTVRYLTSHYSATERAFDQPLQCYGKGTGAVQLVLPCVLRLYERSINLCVTQHLTPTSLAQCHANHAGAMTLSCIHGFIIMRQRHSCSTIYCRKCHHIIMACCCALYNALV